jgi:Chaperone of endosialidase
MIIDTNITVKDKVVAVSMVAVNMVAATFTTTSDYRIKSNIAPLTDTYTVDQLNPVSYYNALTKRNDIGLLAHELQDLYPYLVYGKKDDTEHQSINYASLISILIREVKELKKKVNALSI